MPGTGARFTEPGTHPTASAIRATLEPLSVNADRHTSPFFVDRPTSAESPAPTGPEVEHRRVRLGSITGPCGHVAARPGIRHGDGHMVATESFGTPPRPATRTRTSAPLQGAPVHQMPLRVSNTRSGFFTRSPPFDAAEPKVSTMTSAALLEYTQTSRFASAATANAATVSPAAKFIVDVAGAEAPEARHGTTRGIRRFDLRSV